MGKANNYGGSEDSPDACFGAPGLCVATADQRLGRWAQAENRFTITYCPPTDGPISQADIESTNLQCELPTPAPL